MGWLSTYSPLLPDNLRSFFRPTPWKERTDPYRLYLYCSSWPVRYFRSGANCSSLDSLITRMSRGGRCQCYLHSQTWTEMMASWALVVSIHFFCLLGWVECGWWYALVLQHTHWGLEWCEIEMFPSLYHYAILESPPPHSHMTTFSQKNKLSRLNCQSANRNFLGFHGDMKMLEVFLPE